VLASKRNDFFFTSHAAVDEANDAASVDDAVILDTGSCIIGIVGKLQFKVSAASIEDFLRVALVFVVVVVVVVVDVAVVAAVVNDGDDVVSVALSFCVDIFECQSP
jgi:hypothetical protein